MVVYDNVFSPSFGNRPSELVGRDDIVRTFVDGLKSPPGSRDRAVLITGQRGMGKTVLLLELAERARKEGYIVTSPTIASDDMLERIIEKIQSEGEKIHGENKNRLTGGNIGFLGFSVGLQFSREDKAEKSFTYRLTKLTEAINDAGRGVLILVDEIQAGNPGMKQLVIAYQELVGGGADVAVAFAGLPGAISALLNDKVLTFLNRANRIELGPLKSGDIDAYYHYAFEKIGVKLIESQIERAVSLTEGSPYMMQLIGYFISKYADSDGKVTDEVLERAVSVARKQFTKDVCATTLNSLSEVDISFLSAMSLDEDRSNITEIAKRMDVSNEYAQRYKKRLIDAGVIVQPRRGEVEFDIPMLSEYLRNNR